MDGRSVHCFSRRFTASTGRMHRHEQKGQLREILCSRATEPGSKTTSPGPPALEAGRACTRSVARTRTSTTPRRESNITRKGAVSANRDQARTAWRTGELRRHASIDRSVLRARLRRWLFERSLRRCGQCPLFRISVPERQAHSWPRPDRPSFNCCVGGCKVQKSGSTAAVRGLQAG